MKVTTLLNEKGGVGKSTLATHIAAGLSIKGLRVLLIDADAQGHAGLSLGMAKAPGLYDLLARDAEWDQVLRVPSEANFAIPGERVTGELWLLPSNVETRVIPMVIDDVLL